MERIGTTLDGKIILVVTIDELKAIGKFTATDKEVHKIWEDAYYGYGNTEVGKVTNGKILRGLYTRTILHLNFTPEDIEAHLSKHWSKPPKFEFDGTIKSYLEIAARLTELPMVGAKKAEEIHRTILNAINEHS